MALVFACTVDAAQGQASYTGRVDASFRPDFPPELRVPLYVGAQAYVATQPDGKILFGGDLGGEDGGVVRLHPDGTSDSSFYDGATYPFASLTALVVQPDGKILLGGNGLVRLLANGELDPNFSAELSGDGEWAERTATRVVMQPDGKIMVSGGFSHVNGLPQRGLARLQTDGSVDASFNVAANDLPETIEAVQVQADGKVLVAGYADRVGSREHHFIRLMPDGARDNSFVPALDRGVSVIAMQTDRKILVAGYRWESYYEDHGYILRLNGDGSHDETFGGEPGEVEISGYNDEGVHALLLQPDGKIIVGGSFFNSEGFDNAYGSLFRLHSDGLPDVEFEPRLSLQSGADDIASVTSMALQTDGRLLIAGDFSWVGGVLRPGIARLFTGSDDCQGVISFSADSYSSSEGNRELAVTVQREGDQLGPITVQYAIQPVRDDSGYLFFDGIIGGQPAEDFVELTGAIDFAAGETSKSFSVPVRNDALIEPTESFEVLITETTRPAAFGDRVRALLNIFDDDSLGLPGALDFRFGGRLSGTVKALLPQSDGKLLVGGNFTALDSAPRSNLLRLNADGTLDLGFVPPADLPAVDALALQADGKIIVGGAGVRRLATNGTLDGSFQSLDASEAVDAIAIQPDDGVLVGGPAGLRRLRADGVPDATFDAFRGLPQTSHVSHVRAVVVQPDGKIISGGENAITQLPVVVRLNADGSGDSAFHVPTFQMGYHGGFDLGVLSLLLQPDGKIVVGGGFSYVTQTRNDWNLLRLNADGTLDMNFSAQLAVNTYIRAIARQADGKLLIGGYFWLNNGAGVGLNRLFENGMSDHSFFTGIGALAGVHAIAVLSNGSIWIGGTFAKYNGYPQAALARLHGDDQIGPGHIEFVQSYGPVKENAGQVTLQVRRYWGSDGPVTVQYATSNGTAVAGIHYLARTGTLEFAAGELEKMISIPLLDDSIPEFNRHFTVHLTQPTGNAVLGEFASTWVNILENDRGILARRTEQRGNQLFFRDDFNIRENAGAIRIELFYVGDPTDGPIDVSYTTSDRSAHAGSDYSARSGSTSFGGPYSTQQDFSVPILSDRIQEPPETFTITLQTAAGGVMLMQREITVTIIEPAFSLQPHPEGRDAAGHYRMLMEVLPDTPFCIEASTNLVDWSVLASFPAQTSGDPIEFVDPDSGNFDRRFYRIAPPR